MATIHPTSIVSDESELAPDVEIGPHCVLTGAVRLAAGVRCIANVCLQGPVTVGERTVLYPGACVGFEPQDYKFKPGMPTAGVSIGAECLIREHVTLHAATSAEIPTSVGDACFLMVGSHLGHDARIGNRVIMVNYAALAGHSEVEDSATLSGHVGIHQNVRIGRMAFISGGIGVGMDVPPFCISGERNRLSGLNLVGLRRSGMPREEITRLRRVFRDVLRRPMPREEMMRELERRSGDSEVIGEIAAFVRKSKRGICSGQPRAARGGATGAELAIEDDAPRV